MSKIKYCTPKCNLFKCEKRATIYRGDDVWCRWTDERCNIANCNFPSCVKRRLLSNGVCGETVKRKTVEKRMDEIVGSPVKLRGKALRRVGEKEIF